MTLSEAERRARSNLYRYEDNAELLEHEESLAEMIRERGSRVEQQYGDKPGKVSAHYVDAVPAWFLALEDVERVYYELWSAVSTVRGFLKYLQQAAQEYHREHEARLFELCAMKYQSRATVPELKRHFGQKLKTLDQDLIFRLIHWHSWPIDRDGGEAYATWLRKNWY